MSSSSSDEEEEDTSEPLLKYRRVKASVVHILNGGSAKSASTTAPDTTNSATTSTPLRPPDTITCAHFHPTALFLGTQSGTLYILDHLGNELMHLSSHTARINDVSTDVSGTRVVTCGDDGKVVVHAIQTNMTWSSPDMTSSNVSSTTTSYGRPMLSVTLDPLHSTKRERVFASGSVDGRLRVNRRGWFTSNDTVLHEGEGPVHIVRWTGSLVAWANDYGVKLYDYDRNQRISYIERPRPRMEKTRVFDPRQCECCLYWEVPEKKLLVGWGDCWMVVQITERTAAGADLSSSSGANGAGVHTNGSNTTNTTNTTITTTTNNNTTNTTNNNNNNKSAVIRSAEIVALHYTTDYVISGICNFGDDVALLAFVPLEELQNDDSSDEDDHDVRPIPGTTNGDTTPLRVRPSRPELRIVDRRTGEQLSEDMLPVYGFARCCPRDYRLVSDQDNSVRSSSSVRVHEDALSPDILPSLYIVSPKDIVVASPRTVEDHIKWSLEHDQYDAALEIAEHAEPPLSKERLQNLAERYLAHLVHDGEFQQAASLCPRLLQYDVDMWCRWVMVFSEHDQLLLMGDQVPTSECRLPPLNYEKILSAFVDETSRARGNGGKKGSTLMATIEFLELLFRWLLPDEKVNSQVSRDGRNGGKAPGRPSVKQGDSVAASSPLFDLDTIVRRVLRILPDIALRDAAAPAHQRYSAPLMHLALAHLYQKMESHEQALAQYLDASLLNAKSESLLDSSQKRVAAAEVSWQARAHTLLRHRLDVFELIRKHRMHSYLVTTTTANSTTTTAVPTTNRKENREGIYDDSGMNSGGSIAGLLRLDGAKALELFVNAPQSGASSSGSSGGSGGSGNGSGAGLSIQNVTQHLERHPKLQLRYLDGVWQHPRAKQTYNDSSFAELHKLQVQLYSEHQPEGLLPFLQSSEHYDLRRAFVVCQSTAPPMHQEMVYILSRLGNTKEALALIIEELEDVPQAIEFIKDSHDSSLWSDLVDRSLKSPRFIAGYVVCYLFSFIKILFLFSLSPIPDDIWRLLFILLSLFYSLSFLLYSNSLLGNIGTAVMMEKDQGVDPAQLISKIPMGMRVPGLRDKLVKIISDYTMQLQLRESCNLVLKADCFELLKKLCYQQRRAMRVVTNPSEIALRQRLQNVASTQRKVDRSSTNRSHAKTDSSDFMTGSKRRSTSIGTEPGDMYSAEDGTVMDVSFSDKMCYPGQAGDHIHTTRQPVDLNVGGGSALPRFE
jgi:hypothetical protein